MRPSCRPTPTTEIRRGDALRQGPFTDGGELSRIRHRYLRAQPYDVAGGMRRAVSDQISAPCRATTFAEKNH